MYNDPTIVPFGSHVVGTGNGEWLPKLDRLISSISGYGCGGERPK
jgi:hypothetical protein